MELLGQLLMGFDVALTAQNLMYCLMGVSLGTLVGVLPGIGPMVAIAMLLPITFTVPPVAALVMLAGIYYGAQYGSSTAAILINLPGEASSIVTCIDGHAMAKAGRAGPALAIVAIGSFAAGCIGTLLIAMFAPPLARLVLEFNSADYCSLMVLGLLTTAVLCHGSLLKAMAMAVLGLLMGLVGLDLTTGIPRFTFDQPALTDGIPFVVIAMGLFGIAEAVANLEAGSVHREVISSRIDRLMPSREDLKRSLNPILRGTGVGSIFGILPGAGPAISSFASYALEKRVARDPSRFGKGEIAGVAGPESANNAAAQTAFIPTLTLGIPGSATMALMLGALTIQGISPGPRVMTDQPELFWGLVASMWIGNLALLVLNLPMVGVWVRLITIPYRYLYPAILVLVCIGTYSFNYNTTDLVYTAMFGALGYIFIKTGCEAAPFMLGFILGPLLEENMRRALLISRGDYTVFVSEPVSLGLLAASALLLLSTTLSAVKRGRKAILHGENT